MILILNQQYNNYYQEGRNSNKNSNKLKVNNRQFKEFRMLNNNINNNNKMMKYKVIKNIKNNN